MRRNLFAVWAPVLLMTFVAAAFSGCARSRAEILQDRSAEVEGKLQAERDRVLADSAAADRDSRISHLQTLRAGLSMVNVSIVSVPLVLSTEDERAVGYSVLDEALGTIDWNIPIYGSGSSAQERPYPSLFSPQTGLNFAGIRAGNRPPGISR